MTSGMSREDTLYRFSEKTQKTLFLRAIEIRNQFPGMTWKSVAERLGISVFRLREWRKKWEGK